MKDLARILHGLGVMLLLACLATFGYTVISLLPLAYVIAAKSPVFSAVVVTVGVIAAAWVLGHE